MSLSDRGSRSNGDDDRYDDDGYGYGNDGSAGYGPYGEDRDGGDAIRDGGDRGGPGRPKSRGLAIGIIAFAVVASGFFAYYAVNQDAIDSEIIGGMVRLSPEQILVRQYAAGEPGSDHAHAAIAVFVNEERVDFGPPQFQLQSRYIHFENHNPYLIHKHATGVPLEILFVSIGLDVSPGCIAIAAGTGHMFCEDSENVLTFVVNGRHYPDVARYEIDHGDRILISYGDPGHVEGQLEYLESLEIHDIPQDRDRIGSEGDFAV